MNQRGQALAWLAIVVLGFIVLAAFVPAVLSATLNILNAIFH